LGGNPSNIDFVDSTSRASSVSPSCASDAGSFWSDISGLDEMETESHLYTFDANMPLMAPTDHLDPMQIMHGNVDTSFRIHPPQDFQFDS